MDRAFQRLVSRFERRYAELAARGRDLRPFAVRANGDARTFGGGEPKFTLVASDPAAVRTLAGMDRLLIGEAYLAGKVDVEGDMVSTLAMREFFADRHPFVFAWSYLRPRLVGQQENDARVISEHYDTESDFFLHWLDSRHRCYSHGVFADDAEPLEDAITRKLDFALDTAEIRPGARVLDVGGGWGAFTEYGGRKDVRVTSLTISRESERFLKALIEREKLPCEVKREHFYDHAPAEKYDAIVVLGVTEHLPDYPRSLTKYRSLLKPGGKVYLDASAARKKYALGSFLLRHIYPGNGSTMCLHDYLAAAAKSPFEVEQVHNDRHNYLLTMRHWAERLDASAAEIERRWGRALYRTFRLYLWGCVDGFQRDDLQAYRVVLALPKAAG